MHLDTKSSIRVPGKLESHYQPEKPLYCFSDLGKLKSFYQQAKNPVYVISFTELDSVGSNPHYLLPNSPEQAAFELYFQLRRADESGASCIVIELPPKDEHWEGVRERMMKAGHRP